MDKMRKYKNLQVSNFEISEPKESALKLFSSKPSTRKDDEGD